MYPPNSRIAQLQAALAEEQRRAAANATATSSAGSCDCGPGSGPPIALILQFAEVLAEKLSRRLMAGSMGMGAPCLELPLPPTYDANGCPTGVRICKREQALSSSTVAAGASGTATVTPPGKAAALQFVSAAAAATWVIDEVKIGSVQVVQGPIAASSFSSRFRFDLSAGWGLFDSSKPVQFAVTNSSAGALDTSGVGSLLYYSWE